MATDDTRLRRDLRELLQGGNAHLRLEQALSGLEPGLRNRRVGGLRSVWELLEHMRLAQEDILRYTQDQRWHSPPWPEGYWPAPEAYSDEAWQKTRAGFERDLRTLLDWLDDPGLELSALLPQGEGRSYLRQFLLVADHNAYHLGQIVQVRRALGAWPE